MPEASSLKPLLADLHLHTVLSACAEVEKIPPLIVRQARRLGLGLIAVTDHNACGNAAAVMEAAAGTGLTVLPGMELQTREEVHLLCLFGALECCLEWQEEVWRLLPPLENREEFFGPQYVVDREGKWFRTEGRLLQVSAGIALEEAVDKVHRRGGLAIPAHVDRPSFSLLANLGLVPTGLAADALEVTARWRPEAGFKMWPDLKGQTLIVSGDAHRLAEMQSRTLLKVAEPTVEEIRLALRGEAGRKVTATFDES
jgi:predicted metal-dependent phosphoesterase TrpH